MGSRGGYFENVAAFEPRRTLGKTRHRIQVVHVATPSRADSARKAPLRVRVSLLALIIILIALLFALLRYPAMATVSAATTIVMFALAFSALMTFLTEGCAHIAWAEFAVFVWTYVLMVARPNFKGTDSPVISSVFIQEIYFIIFDRQIMGVFRENNLIKDLDYQMLKITQIGHAWFTVVFGLLGTVLALWIDRKSQRRD